MSNRLKGTLFMILSALAMALMGASVKLTGGNIPTFEKIFFRNIIIVILLLFITNKSKLHILGTSNKGRAIMIIRSATGLVGVFLYFYCINYMYLADSTLLNKLSPFFVTLFAILFLKEKLEKHHIPILITVLIGAMLVIKPKFSSEVIPAIICFISAAFAGGAYTIVRFLKDYETPETIVFWFSAFSAIMMIPLIFIYGFVTPTSMELLYLILTGVFSAIAQIALSYSYKYALASEVSIYQYLSIIFSAIIGFGIWQEIPDIYSVLGFSLIIVCAFINYHISNKK